MRAVLDISVMIATDVPPLEGELATSAAALAELNFGVLAATAHAHSARLYTRNPGDLIWHRAPGRYRWGLTTINGACVPRWHDAFAPP